MTAIPSTHWRLWTGIAIAIHFLLILLLGLSRHWGYMSSLNDLGVFDQAVWGTLNGQFLLNTSNQLSEPINWLGFHFHPVLLLFVPLYAIAPFPEWFALAQALALSIAAWPIFLLTSRVCQSEKAGLLWALTYLVNPFLLNAAAWDFHPVALAVPFVALGMLAVEKGDSRLLFLSCLPLLFIQEHLGLTVMGFGLLWRLRNKTWKPAIWLILLGVAHAALVLGFIMPALSPTGEHMMLSSGLGANLSRYGWIGHSAGEVIQALLTRPLSIIKMAMAMDGAVYLGLLLLPFLGLPLAAIPVLLPGLADLAANLLSANSMPKSVFSYHSLVIVPVLTVAASYGAERISRRVKKFSVTEISGLALTAGMVTGYGFAPLPLPGSSNFWEPSHFMGGPDPIMQVIRAATPANASVSAQANVGAHLSERHEIYVYPNKIGQAGAIVLRLESPTKKLYPQDPGLLAALAGHLQMRPADYLASIECLLASKEYGVTLWRDPWLIFSRGAITTSSPRQELESKIMLLRKEWGVAADEYNAALETCKKQGRDMQR
ncbi:MAG: DUF2079 domain-containing protein [Sulfuricella sp.]|nr:DUF2079 domain-containing protein [Sulfuricella sp.]